MDFIGSKLTRSTEIVCEDFESISEDEISHCEALSAEMKEKDIAIVISDWSDPNTQINETNLNSNSKDNLNGKDANNSKDISKDNLFSKDNLNGKGSNSSINSNIPRELYLQLLSLPFFQFQSENFFKEISTSLHVRKFAPKEIIIKHGDSAKAIFFVIKGYLITN
jgi:hypothetical protein